MTLEAPAKRVLIMAGGTGGHVFPALALAKELQGRGCEVQWLGTSLGIESRLVPQAGITLNTISVAGVRGKGWKSLLQAPANVGRAVLAARRLLQAFKPQVVVGLGGYAAGPGGVAARTCGLPLVIHEQNARPGTTNKLLSRFAQRVLTGFPNVFANGIHIGNPVRAEFFAVDAPAVRLAGRDGPINLLILGGSLGAQALNQLLPEALSSMPESKRPVVRHQTGERHFDATKTAYAAAQVEAKVEAFVGDVAGALAWADLVVCRSGALTVAELCAVGCASILVPFPHAIDDHQTANARWLEDNQAALIFQQKDLDAQVLTELLTSFASDRPKLLKMAAAAKTLAQPHAAARFADICMEVAHA